MDSFCAKWRSFRLTLAFVPALVFVLIPWTARLDGAGASSPQTRPQMQRPPMRPITRVPASAASSPMIERAIQASSKVERYRFRIDQQPAVASVEGEIDNTTKTVYLRISPTRRGVPTR